MIAPQLSALVLIVASTSALAQTASPGGDPEEALTRSEETFGAAIGPAALPPGSLAYYAYVGVPELTLGARQGGGWFELEGRARFHYLDLSVALEVLARRRVWRQDALDLALYGGFGVAFNSGATYVEAGNFGYAAVRPIAGAVLDWRISDTVRGLALFELPYDVVVTTGGGGRLDPLLGAGVELFLGDDLSGMVLGRVGVDLLLPPGAPALARFGYELRLGLGYRLF